MVTRAHRAMSDTDSLPETVVWLECNTVRSDTNLQTTLNILQATAECGGQQINLVFVERFGLMNNESKMDTIKDAPIQRSRCVRMHEVFVKHFPL